MDLVSIVSNSFDAYQIFQQNHPLLGSVITSEITFVSADIVCQFIEDKKINPKKISYTAACAPMYGTMIYGLLESGNMVGKYISDNPLVMAALGPNLFGNFVNAHFYANNKIGENNNYDLFKSAMEYYSFFEKGNGIIDKTKNALEQYIKKIPKKEYMKATVVTLTAWNAIQAINYAYIPLEMRTPFSLTIGSAWTTVLTMWSMRSSRQEN